MPAPTILSYSKIRHLAGPRSFQRGEDYFQSGRVQVIAEEKESLIAKVRGSHNYSVKIHVRGKEILYSCSCPMGEGDVFCKHLVAAGLAWIEGESHDNKPVKEQTLSKPTITAEDVHAYLLKQDKETLVKMLMDQTADDDRLRERLFLKVAQQSLKGLDLTPYRRAIDNSVDTGDFVEYRHMWDYCRQIEDVVNSVGELKDKRPAEAIGIIEYFIEAVEEHLDEVDDSDGDMGGILHRLQKIHYAACKTAQPDPIALAERLFEWELKTGCDTFYNAVKTYADVLGVKGIARYRELAEAVWNGVPPLRPEQDASERHGSRFRVTHIMEALAEQDGDIEALVAVKSRDLSSAYSYLSIAEIYKKEGRKDEALDWAERGVKAFPIKTDSRLREFLAEEYHRRKRHDEAMDLIWAEFSEDPSLEDYKKLKAHADRTDQWPAWREKGLIGVREKIAQEKQKCRRHSWGWRPDHSLLVQIFLWEKDGETAWQEAKAGDCARHLWLELARKQEKAHPENALEIYQKLIGPTIDQKNNSVYEEAVSYLKKIKASMTLLDRAGEFPGYLESIRTKHKPKRNLMKLIDRHFETDKKDE